MYKDIGLEQWESAQKWEKSFWDRFVKQQQSIGKLRFLKTFIKKYFKSIEGETSNYWWEKAFDGYNFVPQELGNVIEFGCGPFTNLRLILKNREAHHVVASDPLARHYVTYNGILAKKWKKRQWLIDDHSLEEKLYADGVFDLAVCINVLDHVRDVNLCLANLIRVVKAGGILILGQELTNDDDLRATAEKRQAAGDVGHPHKFSTEETLIPYLEDFKPILHKVVTREKGRLPAWHCGTFVFAGEKQ